MAQDPASSAAAVGSTPRATSDLRSGTGTIRATATTIWGFAVPELTPARERADMTRARSKALRVEPPRQNQKTVGELVGGRARAKVHRRSFI